MNNNLLTGIRVLDLSQYLPGPYATQLLADLGAEVVKIEPPSGDPMRVMDGVPEGQDSGASYRMINAGKTVLRLNLKDAADQAKMRALVAQADVLLESLRPGVMDRLGFDRANLQVINPTLVHVALTGWGYDGPYSKRAGHDINYMAIAGGLAASGTADQPVAPFPPVSDMASGMMAALTAVSGLIKAKASGQGMFLDVSIMETALSWQGWGLTALAQGQSIKRGQSLLSGGAACYQLYRTADDRWLSVGALEAKFWATFCDALDQSEWINRQHEPMPQTDLIAEVAAVIAQQPLEHWVTLFTEVDCCVEPVLDWSEVAAHDHIAARGQVQPQEDVTEVLIGLRVDGAAKPKPRRPLRELTAEQLLDIWGGAVSAES